MGKRKSPIDVRGAVVATKEVLTMGPPAGRSSKAGAVTAARGRSAAARDAIVEETAEDVEDSSS